MTNQITYTLSAHDDGYRIRDWFEGGQVTLDAAEEAETAAEAEAILRNAYHGPDVDGVEVSWDIESEMTTTYRAAYYVTADGQGSTVLTSENHAGLSDEALIEVAVLEAYKANLIDNEVAEYPFITETSLRAGLVIGDWTE